MDALQAPAWLVALATVFLMGAKAVTIIRGGMGTNGYPQAQTAALQAITNTLSALTERIEHLPTKADLITIAEKNRHDTRATLHETAAALTARVDRAETSILKELGRP